MAASATIGVICEICGKNAHVKSIGMFTRLQGTERRQVVAYRSQLTQADAPLQRLSAD